MQTIEDLCARHAVDMLHARFVAALSMRLFDAACAKQQLPERSRQLLDAGAMLHEIVPSRDEAMSHLAGRDVVIAAPLAGFTHVERAQLACMVAFCEGAVRAQREPLFTGLPPATQHETLILSAILRVAAGLDQSHTQTTQVEAVESRVESQDLPALPPSGLRLCTNGPHSHADAARANSTADLWRAVLGPVTIAARLDAPHITPDNTLADAAHKVLRYRFDWSGGHAAWQFDRPDAVTPQRVRKLRLAVRRMRNDVRLFEPGLKDKIVRPLDKVLRTWSGMLRDARANDQLLGTLRDYLNQCDDDARAGLTPLLDAWQHGRTQAESAIVAAAADEPLPDAVEAFLANDAHRRARPGEPSHVRHIAAAAVCARLADVRAFDTLPDPPDPSDLHGLRLAIKRLRYTLEALDDALPADQTSSVLAQCIAAHDALGPINDARSAAAHTTKFLLAARSSAQPRVALKGIATYAEAQQRAAETRMAGWRESIQLFQ